MGAAGGGRVVRAARWNRSAGGGWNGAEGSTTGGSVSGRVRSRTPHVGLCLGKSDTWQVLSPGRESEVR